MSGWVCRGNPAIVGLILDDRISATRDSPDPAPYEAAFRRIDGDPAQLLVAAVLDDEVVGTLQLKRRTDAHRFYARLGFTASHEGFELQL